MHESCELIVHAIMYGTCITYLMTVSCGPSSVWHHSTCTMSHLPLCFFAVTPPTSINLGFNSAVVLLRVPVLKSRAGRPRTLIATYKEGGWKQRNSRCALYLQNHWYTHSLDTTLSYLVGRLNMNTQVCSLRDTSFHILHASQLVCCFSRML